MNLTEKDQITYLANVFFIALCDGALSPKEAVAIEEIRASIGAKKSTQDRARKLAESNTYFLSCLDSFATRVSNLADLIYVSVADGELHENEKRILADFYKTTNLTDEQILLLTRDAISRAKNKETYLACPSCKTAVSSNLNFCPNCGTGLNQANESTDFAVPKSGYAIEFSESTAAAFPNALKFAQQAPTFLSAIRNKKMWYLAAWPEDSFAKVVKLADLLGGIRNRKCHHDGTEVRWDDLFGFVWCANERARAYSPQLYCFGKDENRLNPWGCKRSEMEWTEWARWFAYGRFEMGGILGGRRTFWIFDKARIRHELMARLHEIRYCPHLRPKLVEAVLEILPEKVEIEKDGDWKYNQIYEEVPGSIKVVEIEKSNGIEFRQEYFSNGARPKGTKILEQVLRKAFDRAHVTEIEISTLLR